MYKRFNYSITKPAQLKQFLNDSYKRVFAFFFILILIALIPTTINEFRTKGLRDDQLLGISSGFRDTLAGNYSIIDGKLDTSNLDFNTVSALNLDLVSITLRDNPYSIESSAFTLILKEETIVYRLSMFKIYEFSYADYGLENFDFSDIRLSNITTFTNAIKEMMISVNATHKTVLMIFYFLSETIGLLLLLLLGSILIGRGVPFNIKFKAMVYASTVYIILNLMANLYGLYILGFIGIVLMVVNANRVFTVKNGRQD